MSWLFGNKSGGGKRKQPEHAKIAEQLWQTHEGENPVSLLAKTDFIGASQGFMELAKDEFATHGDKLKFRSDATTCMAIAYGGELSDPRRKEVDTSAAKTLPSKELKTYNQLKQTLREHEKRGMAIHTIQKSYGIVK